MPVRICGLSAWTMLLSCSIWMAGVANAQSDNPWNGFYASLTAGAAHGTSCAVFTPSGDALDAATVSTLTNEDCLGNSVLGGFQVGENFQHGRLVWGVGVDIDIWHATNSSFTVAYSGATLPQGTYNYSDRLGPRGFAIVGPRIGYAGNLWQPYIRVGAIVPFGAQDSELSFTPNGTKKSIASFQGGKSFSSVGWVGGGGLEWGLNGAWSISVEYLHASFGKGSSNSSACAGSAANCAQFSGISFGDVHDAPRANLFRVGITYWFNYWDI